MNRARVKKVLFALISFLVLIQIFQPARSNPPATPSRSLRAHVPIQEDAYSALIRSCGDCHSNETRWPWYSHVGPISWVITDDVNEGRRHMNFDDWEALGDGKLANDRLINICDEIKHRGMPPFSYRLVHRHSRLTLEESASICAWSQPLRANPSGFPGHP
jgi:hypothetical protein